MRHNARAVVTRRRASLLAAFFVLLLISLALMWQWRGGVKVEGCNPDQFDFGTVDAGSALEFSVRFLANESKGAWERLGIRLAAWSPKPWQPRLREWFKPSRPPAPFVAVDLKLLHPKVETPDFVEVKEVTPRQEKLWYGGKTFVVVHGRLILPRAGRFSGKIKVTLDKRQALLPIRVRVRDRAAGRPRLLVVTTPYQEYSTEKGSDFEKVTGILSALGASVDCLEKLPAGPEAYRAILLADDSLAGISPEEVERVRAFVEKGGRLILACNAFFNGTVPKANEILEGHGLQVENKDMTGVHNATNIVASALTRGVLRLEFHRPSPMTVTDVAKGQLLALDPNGPGGFVAGSRLDGGGEIIVLGASLWWHWVTEFKDSPDNARLLQNLLSVVPGK